MEEARAVLERLDRIDALVRAGAGRPDLLAELRALLDEAAAWSRREGGEAGEKAVDDLRRSLSRAIIGA